MNDVDEKHSRKERGKETMRPPPAPPATVLRAADFTKNQKSIGGVEKLRCLCCFEFGLIVNLYKSCK